MGPHPVWTIPSAHSLARRGCRRRRATRGSCSGRCGRPSDRPTRHARGRRGSRSCAFHLYCYWVGSLGFNVLVEIKLGFPLNPQKVKHCLQKGQQQPSDLLNLDVKVLRMLRSSRGMGQNQTTKGLLVSAFVSIYQGSMLGSYF